MAFLNPYLSFRTEAREAMEFYRDALGGDLEVTTFGAYPGMVENPEQQSLVMHAQLTTSDGLVLMGADTPDGVPYEKPAGISVSLSGNTKARAQEVWDALSDGATITMPLDTPPWGGTYGMLVDRYGIAWMVHSDPEA